MKVGDLFQISENDLFVVPHGPRDARIVEWLQVTLDDLLEVSAEFLLRFD